MITLGTTFAEEVVTGLVYLGIASVDSVEYSGLMIDGERIVGIHFGDDPVDAHLELKADEAGNLMAFDLLIM